MEEAKLSAVPAEPGLHLSAIESTEDEENKTCKRVPYWEAVGSLLFAARISRPNIEFSVNKVSQFLTNFKDILWQAVKRIFRYLVGTVDYEIMYGKSQTNFHLTGYTDADHAGCIDTRKSTSGFVFMMYGGLVTWSSQKQPVVPLSTTEAEYIALVHDTKDAMWLSRMLRELNFKCSCVPIFVDNQSAIDLSSNPEHHKRTKHIDVRYHFVRDEVYRKIIDVHYIPTREQLADIFTKALEKQQFLSMRNSLNTVKNTK